jgi:hypothetical protein
MEQLSTIWNPKTFSDQDLFENIFSNSDNSNNMLVSLCNTDEIDSEELDLFLNKELNCESTINLSHILQSNASNQTGSNKMTTLKDYNLNSDSIAVNHSSNNNKTDKIYNNDNVKSRKENNCSNKKRKLSPSESSTDELARFGNKYVKKYTNEYAERRVKNNVAVKKCRQKINKIQIERETRLKQLSDENRRLTNTVDTLTKELSVLKNILLQMNPNNRLPLEIENKLRLLENTIGPT